MEKKIEDKIESAILKVALGCCVKEVTEEYAEVDGQLKLTKRRKTEKDIPPDLKAVQMLLSAEGGGGVAAMSDEELETERQKLLSALKEEEGKATVKKAVKPRAKPRKRVVRRTKKI